MLKLSKRDFQILHALEHDARQPLSRIAKQLRTSEQVINYRIKRLERAGVIGGYYTFIDNTCLGFTSFRTMIQFSNADQQVIDDIIHYLHSFPNVLWLARLGGRWDLLVDIDARDVHEFNELLGKLRDEFPKQIQNYDVLLIRDVTMFGRDYFITDRREEREPPVLGRAKPVFLDELDHRLLQTLAQDARRSSVSLAKELGVTANTIVNRIRRLKQSGIIQAFKPLIHLEKIGYQTFKLLLRLRNLTREDEKKLLRSFQPDARVAGIIRLIGEWNFEIEFEVPDRDALDAALMEFRNKLKEHIQVFELLPIYRDYLYNFYPATLRPADPTS